ncbi:MAG: hypothetical protein M3535_09035 [Actinomycetota bacterium]|nr:hypothetical protein [Actinomycetota bacterium]
MTSQFTVQVPIPVDTSPGQHFLVATQNHFDMNVGNTARAAIYVDSSPPAAPTSSPRPTSLAVSDGPSVVSFALIGLGVAAGGLLLAGVASTLAARRPASGRREGAKAS